MFALFLLRLLLHSFRANWVLPLVCTFGHVLVSCAVGDAVSGVTGSEPPSEEEVSRKLDSLERQAESLEPVIFSCLKASAILTSDEAK